jgi:hypothetical protein
MVRSKSIWLEMQRERDRRARVALAQQPEQRQVLRLRIVEGGELKHLLAEYLHLDVRIDLARTVKQTR